MRSPMTDLVSPSPEELATRRRSLRRQRRMRNLQNLWRGLAVSGMAIGTLWLIAHPFWLLRSPDQVVVEGNELLSDEAIQGLLPLTYPHPLLEVKPTQMAQLLTTQGPIAAATVNRQLFPPRLEILVQERYPVAVTLPDQPPASAPEDAAATPTPTHQPGLIDSQGYWMPQASFQAIDPDFELPELKIRGFDADYQAQWPDLYQAIQASSVTVTEIDWRIPSNVILHTQLGLVHLGIYDAQAIEQQLSTLARLRSLEKADNSLTVEYIDLSNPKTPAVKVRPAPQ